MRKKSQITDCEVDDEGDPIDVISLDKIDPDNLISYEEGNKRWCFDIESLYRYTYHEDEYINPSTRQKLPDSIIKQLEQYGADKSVIVRIAGMEYKINGVSKIGNLIIDLIRKKSRDDLQIQVTNIAQYDIIDIEGKSLYDFDLEDEIYNVLNTVENLDYQIMSEDVKKSKLSKMKEFAEGRTGGIYQELYLTLSAILEVEATSRLHQVDIPAEEEEEHRDFVRDIEILPEYTVGQLWIMILENMTTSIEQSYTTYDIVDQYGTSIYLFGLDDNAEKTFTPETAEQSFLNLVPVIDLSRSALYLKNYIYAHNLTQYGYLFGNEVTMNDVINEDNIHKKNLLVIENFLKERTYTQDDIAVALKLAVESYLQLIKEDVRRSQINHVKSIVKMLMSREYYDVNLIVNDPSIQSLYQKKLGYKWEYDRRKLVDISRTIISSNNYTLMEFLTSLLKSKTGRKAILSIDLLQSLQGLRGLKAGLARYEKTTSIIYDLFSIALNDITFAELSKKEDVVNVLLGNKIDDYQTYIMTLLSLHAFDDIEDMSVYIKDDAGKGKRKKKQDEPQKVDIIKLLNLGDKLNSNKIFKYVIDHFDIEKELFVPIVYNVIDNKEQLEKRMHLLEPLYINRYLATELLKRYLYAKQADLTIIETLLNYNINIEDLKESLDIARQTNQSRNLRVLLSDKIEELEIVNASLTETYEETDYPGSFEDDNELGEYEDDELGEYDEYASDNDESY